MVQRDFMEQALVLWIFVIKLNLRTLVTSENSVTVIKHGKDSSPVPMAILRRAKSLSWQRNRSGLKGGECTKSEKQAGQKVCDFGGSAGYGSTMRGLFFFRGDGTTCFQSPTGFSKSCLVAAN